MNKEEILELLNKYKSSYSDAINNNNFENLANDILLLNKLSLAELKAKVYTYEKIIANSNFKSINNKSVESLNKKIKELEKELEILKGDNNDGNRKS